MTVPDDILAAEQWTCEVERATQLAPLIRELVLRVPDDTEFRFRAGAYVQIEAPAYTLKLADLPVEARFEPAWKRLGVKALSARNPAPTHRAYSIASRPRTRAASCWTFAWRCRHPAPARCRRASFRPTCSA